MKLLNILLPAFISFTFCFAQTDQDPEAKVILDKASSQIKSYTTIIADFELTISNKKNNINSTTGGKLFIKDSLYVMESEGSSIVYNGKDIYTYLTDANEVTITPLDDNADFVDNPAKIFTFYQRDFKYQLKGSTVTNGTPMHVIDLYPRDLNQPYSRYIVHINKNTNLISMVKAISKDGIDYTAVINNMKTNTPIKDSKFKFDTEKYPEIIIVDLRF